MTSDWRQAAHGGRWTACSRGRGEMYVGRACGRAACGYEARCEACGMRRAASIARRRRAAAASWLIEREKERERAVERMDRGDREACSECVGGR